MKKLLSLLLYAVTIVTLGACNNEDDGTKDGQDGQNGQNATQLIEGSWVATRQVVTIKLNGTVFMEDDETLTIEDGIALSFTKGNQLFGLMCQEVDGKIVVDEHFYAGQWAILEGNKLKIDYVDDGDEMENGEGFLDMGDVTIESIDDQQLVLNGVSTSTVETQTVETIVKVYFSRKDFSLNLTPVE